MSEVAVQAIIRWVFDLIRKRIGQGRTLNEIERELLQAHEGVMNGKGG